MRILIDPGHGGKDSGAVNPATGQREDRTNYNVSLMLASLMTKAGAEVIFSRCAHEDGPTLAVRMAQIRSAKPDLVLSLHHNASGSGNAKGAEVIAQVKKGRSEALADELASQWRKRGIAVRPTVYKKNSSGTGDYYGILRAAAEVSVPAVITEYAFIDNAEDLRRIDSYEKQMAEAVSIRDAIIAWWATR